MDKKTLDTLKEKLLMEIPPMYAWLIIGGASALTLILMLALIVNA